MKAAYIRQTGPPDVIEFGELPKPSPGPKQALVKVNAVAVNPVDTYIRNGANYWELPNPFIIGCDLAGEVEAVGEEVSLVNTGQRVWATNQGLMGRQGTFAEYCVVDEEWLYPSPDTVDDRSLAASALVGVTSHLGLVRDARLQPGESLFVNGGSGGVGSMVIQMAKAIGARIIATAGSPEKTAVCQALGSDAVINYKHDDILAVAESFAPEGIDVYWETTREPDFDRIVSMLAERGRIVLMAGREARPEFPVGPFYVKGCSIHGFVMFKATPEELRASAEDINQWFAEGHLKANISKVLPLSAAAEAHQLQEANTLGREGTLAGKIVLEP